MKTAIFICGKTNAIIIVLSVDPPSKEFLLMLCYNLLNSSTPSASAVKCVMKTLLRVLWSCSKQLKKCGSFDVPHFIGV